MAGSFFFTGFMLFMSAGKTKYRRTARTLGLLFMLAAAAVLVNDFLTPAPKLHLR